MIGEAPWEDHHHRSWPQDNNEDYSSDINHPLFFDFLSNTINMVDLERKSVQY